MSIRNLVVEYLVMIFGISIYATVGRIMEGHNSSTIMTLAFIFVTLSVVVDLIVETKITFTVMTVCLFAFFGLIDELWFNPIQLEWNDVTVFLLLFLISKYYEKPICRNNRETERIVG